MNYQYIKNNKKEHPIALSRDFHDVKAFHQSLAMYKPTPLLKLDAFASNYEIQGMYVKDESHRFGLNAFKGLGVSYACSKINKDHITYVTCTDGNHGKALAWMGSISNHPVVVFMPKGSVERRVKAIEAYGAKVEVTNMNYDDTVRYAREYASKNDCILVQDTALEDYIDIPSDIVLGYSTLIDEALHQLNEKPTHVFVQAGVGSLAGGVIWYLANKYKDIPYIGVLEASACPCIYESIKQQKNVAIGGNPQTIMAGLNCGEANPITFPIIENYASFLIACDDELTRKGMERAKHPIGNDPSFSSGESGAVGLGFVEEILKNNRQAFSIDEHSIILVINTEGEL